MPHDFFGFIASGILGIVIGVPLTYLICRKMRARDRQEAMFYATQYALMLIPSLLILATGLVAPAIGAVANVAACVGVLIFFLTVMFKAHAELERVSRAA